MPPSLSGANVFISGGAGFIGSHIADQVLDAGAASVVVLDDLFRGSRENLSSALATERTQLVVGDICDADLVDGLMKDVDIVFHQAALRITHCAEDPVRAVQTMQNGTQTVLEAAVRNKVSKVLAASSASVYGEPSYLPMDEGHPFNNRTLYGALKIANEQMLRAYNEMYGLDYVAMRPFNVYGSRMDTYGVYTEVMIRWLQRLERGEPPIIFGDGSQTMDFVYVEDVARAYLLAATADVTDDVFNIGFGSQTSLLELARAICDGTGHPDVTPVHEAPRAVNGVTRRQAGIEKARDLIGFEAQIDLAEGLQKIIDWYRTIEPVSSGQGAPR
jgi:UDP-glucose 4-epimerase